MERNNKQIKSLKNLIELAETPNVLVYFGSDGSILTIVNTDNGACMDWGSSFSDNLISWSLYNNAANNSAPNIHIPSLQQTLNYIENECDYAECCKASCL